MGAAVLDAPLIALMGEKWTESFEFYIGTEHCPDPIVAGSTAEIALRMRGDDEVIRLTTVAGTCFIDAHRVVANWSKTAIAAAITPGLYDLQVTVTSPEGDPDVRILGEVEWRASL